MEPILAHAGLAGLPDHDELLLLLPLLPSLLIGTIVTGTVLQRRGMLGRSDTTVALAAPLAVLAAGLSLGAAVIHLSVVEAHLVEGGFAVGLFFVFAGGFQLVWAQLHLLRPGLAVSLAGLGVNGLIAATWLASRTVGLPLGSTPWTPAPIGLLDLLATGYEVALIVLLSWSLSTRAGQRRARQIAPLDAFVAGGFGAATIAVLTGLALLWT